MPPSSVGSLEELAGYLAGRGEKPERSPTEVLLPHELSPAVSTHIHISWGPIVRLHVPLGVTVPDDKLEQALELIEELNGEVDSGHCVIGPPLAYEVGATLGADGSLGIGALENALYAARSTSEVAFTTFAPLFRPKLVPPPPSPFTIGSRPTTLTADEIAYAKAACADDHKWFLHRLDGSLDCSLRLQPFWRNHRIIEVQSPLPPPAVGLSFSFGADGSVKALRGHLEHLVEIAAKDPPPSLTDPDQARTYAQFCDGLTTDARWGELPVASYDDIPFRQMLTPEERDVIKELRMRHAADMHAPRFGRTAAGFTLELFTVSMSRLIRRTILVPPDGRIQRNDVILADPIPVPPGKAWAVSGNRVIPVA